MTQTLDPFTIIVDLLAVAAIILGTAMIFAQRRLRSWWASLSGQRRDLGQQAEPQEDPARYFLTIFGMMILAFGVIVFGFFTTFALFRG